MIESAPSLDRRIHQERNPLAPGYIAYFRNRLDNGQTGYAKAAFSKLEEDLKYQLDVLERQLEREAKVIEEVERAMEEGSRAGAKVARVVGAQGRIDGERAPS